ncbi:MarR family transcriptional regulator [Aetokthonos hydrillicola Thurmond2011]|jgi:hypothetical protein|uniref:MarR family transcriptional regulator n=1 Tax=Aetokthonos hydrillicola Thurmond2011 TaxID=2712845 RepID=A0AAP5IEZ9_9CYAN|nr:helix-turn-helix domain-containing protein [Aetokthonos hydrillicola]MBW4591203.1 MarR family transcriptional regulator [Aetokthonos hydrillicola CCALA 1050]MDR9900488.1 MarR family transcriptional regulator [Aetokthonos hydrillicola Thurmond2011]
MAELKKDKAPLFYQLTNKEWVETVKDLTGAEIKVLYHVRSLDPFGDRELDYSVTQVALQLGLSKGAVSKAFKKLDQMNLICVELVRVKVRVNTNKNNITEFSKENSVSYRKHELPIRNENFSEETEVSSSKCSFPIGNEQPPEPLQHKDSSAPHTIHTYTDFINTLSDSERESFVKFGEQKARALPQPPQLPQRWIEKNWEELSAQWHKESGKTPRAQSEKWENHPRRDEWLAEIERTGNPAMFAGSDKEKQAFVTWCWDASQFSWLKEEGNTNGI